MRYVGVRLSFLILGFIFGGFLVVAFADDGDWKKMTCPSASPAAIGTSGQQRLGLCLVNTDDTNEICVSNLASFTCDGTVATDGFPLAPGSGFCETDNSAGFPSMLPRYCRAASSDSVLGYKESNR